jgi:Peptidase family S41
MKTNVLMFCFECLIVMSLSSCSANKIQTMLTKTHHLEIQETPDYKQLNPLQKDVAYFFETLKVGYPKWEQRISPTDLETEKERLLAFFSNNKNKDILNIELQKILARLEDAHTQISIDASSKKFFPINFLLQKNSLIVALISKQNDSALIGSKLLKINDLSMDEVAKRAKKLISAENNEYLLNNLRQFIQLVTFLKMIDVNHNDSLLHLTLLTPQNVVKEVWIKACEKPTFFTASPNRFKHYSTKAYDMTMMPEHDLAYIKVGTFLDYDMIKDGIGDYVHNPLLKPIGKHFMKKQMSKIGALSFKDFFTDAIAKANQAGVEHVVIDLRNNGGGDLRLASEMFYLLNVDTIKKLHTLSVKVSPYFKEQMKTEFVKYDKIYRANYGKPLTADGSIINFDSLMDVPHYNDFFYVLKDASKPVFFMSPKTPRFKGKVYFLINSNTFSAASITASLIKDNHLGTLVGTKSGNRPMTATGGLGFKLPNSKICVRMSYMYSERPDTTQKKKTA